DAVGETQLMQRAVMRTTDTSFAPVMKPNVTARHAMTGMTRTEGHQNARSFMTKSPAIIDLAQWLRTPAGGYLLAWEQAHLDRAVVDFFGFHAVQLGLPELD